MNGIVGVVVGAFVVLDMTISPVLRPVTRFIAQSGPIAIVRRLSRKLPSYVALVFLGIPLAVAEPAKIFGLYLIGDGHYISGIATLAVAYLVSLMLVDTIYEGARPQLRSIGWFATLVDSVTSIKVAVLARVRRSRAYEIASAYVRRVREWIGRRRARFAARQKT